MPEMLDACQIPDWNDRSHQGLVHWWQEMVSRHLAFHPDDAPETVISFVDGQPLFSAPACLKLRRILSDMRTEHGSAVYEVAEQRVMAWLSGEQTTRQGTSE